MKLQLTIEELETLLNEQKQVTADYITRNLSFYDFYRNPGEVDLIKNREQLEEQCLKSGYPNDFNVLKKYIN